MADALGNRADESTRPKGKSAAAFRTISEVAAVLDVPQHVLRFWETRFPQIKPLKRGGGRRYYRPEDVALLQDIRRLLYSEGYTIKGVQRLLRDGGLKAARPAEATAASIAPAPPQPPVPRKPADALPDAARAAIRSAIAELEELRAALTERVDDGR